MKNEAGTDPFEAEGGSYVVLVNGEDQYSLWPDYSTVPEGWRIAHPACNIDESLKFIAGAWTDMRPRSLINFRGGVGNHPGQDADSSSGIATATIHELFARQVLTTPDAEALVSESGRLTYAELDKRVERIANCLLDHGAGPEKIVAVLLERSEDLVVALLAVQRVGASYLPIDVEYPSDRIAYMLEDSAPACIVSVSRFMQSYSVDVDQSILVLLDVEKPTFAVSGNSRRGAPRSPDVSQPHHLDAAYVIYTSGSTGRPKGVVVPQVAIVNHLLWMQRTYALETDDRVLQKTPAGFDVSVWEFFWPLIVGATLIVAPAQAHKSPNELAELIRREQVTTVHFVPPMLDLFLEEISEGDCPSLRRVLASGESLPVSTLRRFSGVLSATLYNLYGPTEAAVDVTWWECSAADLAGPRIPIGFPVAHTGVYVLDAGMRPVSGNAEGELYLTGIQIARCYLNNPELTAQRFVACPFTMNGERMYRTGDLVRWNRDGSLDFIGRADSQFKINGVRVEAGEVESILREYPSINNAVVVVNQNSAGDPTLEAFLTVSEKDAPVLGRLIHDVELPNSTARHVARLAPDLPCFISNLAEARFMYNEIFQDNVYWPHDIALPDGAVVFDVGANIGLFSLFVGMHVPTATIYAFEPLPEIASVLASNVSLYDLNVNVQPYGLAEAPSDSSPFTYYNHVSLISGRYADTIEDKATVRAFAQSELDSAGQELISDKQMSEMIDERLESTQIQVPLRTMSEVISNEGLSRISLVKIDVERSELDVLAGIQDMHWPLIDRFALEVHNIDGRLDVVESMLTDRGFHVKSKKDSAQLKNIFAVYATRYHDELEPPVAPVHREKQDPPYVVRDPEDLLRALRAHAERFLPSSIVPTAMVLLPELPLTANGKIDRGRLTADLVGFSSSIPSREPRSATETVLCDLFREILGLDGVGPEDDFFDLGGTSLTAIRVAAGIRRAFNIPFKLRVMLENSRISDLALRIETALV